ncbi:MAG: adenylyltransferase/cytidyltransferase family protein [Magnetococcales bacterium]|nr:adenylyltransferase/cytidyltransferase family protein [Magnetococcales bacterium]
MEINKIQTLDEIARTAERLRQAGSRVVLCHGTFDLLHPGHMRHLMQASRQGDALLVTLTADRYVSKGPGRPAFPQQLRAESMAALACVDYVAIISHGTGIPAIEAIRPDVYVKGSDYKQSDQDITGNILREKNAVESFGGHIHFTDEITFSSSRLLNQHFDMLSPGVKAYLQTFKRRYGIDAVIKQIQDLAGLKVLVVGEAIIDEYCTVCPMGVTGKNIDVLSSRYESMETFAGGSLAVANHLSGYVAEVTLLTGLGRNDPHEPFIRSKLAENVRPSFFYYEKAQTLVKRRFVDEDLSKLFEVYYYDPAPLTPKLDADLCQWIAAHSDQYDAVIVPDYGNGFISDSMVAALCQHARFLAVNTQINSGNRGYHVITRYERADYISLNGPEIRLAAHNRHDPLEDLALGIGRQLQANTFSVTLGAEGAMMLDVKGGIALESPALLTNVVDRIGAGDSYFALSTLCLAQGGERELALFLGSAAAALDVRIVCNRESIDPVSLLKFATTLLK